MSPVHVEKLICRSPLRRGLLLIIFAALRRNLLHASEQLAIRPIFLLLSTCAALLGAPLAAQAAPDDLYVADGHRILKFTSGGTKTTFASGLNTPEGLAFDRSGNLFVADFGSGNIFKFTPAGVRSTFASGLNFPSAVAFDSSGNLFATDIGSGTSTSGTIFKFAPDGTKTIFASGLGGPAGLAFAARAISLKRTFSRSSNSLPLVSGAPSPPG